MLSPGSYLGLLVEGVAGASPDKKTPCIDIKFRIVSRSVASGWEDVSPSVERRVSIYLSDAAWEWSERKLVALEFNGSFRTPDFGDKAKTDGVVLNCTHEEYKSKTVEKWELALDGGGGKIEEMPIDVARVMEAKWKAMRGTTAKPAAKSAPKSAPPKAAPPPPAPAAQPPVPGNGTTREDAWARTVAGHSDDADSAGKAWAKAIAKVGKPESAMTAADWEAVASDAEVPF